MTYNTSQSLCTQCYVRCPKDTHGRCTHCGAKQSQDQVISASHVPAPSPVLSYKSS
jgi:ribosomal protein L40E